MNRTSSWMAFAILFLGGSNMALPSFGWATPIEIVHGVFLDNALVIMYLAILVSTGATAALTRNARAVRFAAFTALLGSFGIISAGVSPYRLYDVGQAMRLFLFGAFVLLAAHWAFARGLTFVLRPYLIGIAAGGLINLYYTFTQPELIMGLLPTLRARNGAGGMLAIAVSLGAWLMMIRRSRLDALVALGVSATGVSAAAISYSKTSMSIAAFGVLAWLFVLLHGATRGQARMAVATGLALLIAATLYAARSVDARTYAAEVLRFGVVKFSSLDIRDKYSGGDRYLYFWGVGEIVARHPLTGVSYGGFYDAITHTDSYATGDMADEDPSAGRLGLANPHNSFLYYAAANGIPGLVIVVGLFVSFLRRLYRGLGPWGIAGQCVWLCVAGAYSVYAMTLPTLFDTDVLYVPVAVAIALSATAVGSRARGSPGALGTSPIGATP